MPCGQMLCLSEMQPHVIFSTCMKLIDSLCSNTCLLLETWYLMI